MSFISALISIVAIYITIGFAWMGLEKLIYGESTPRLVDDVVAVILAVSLFYNFI